VSAQTCGGGVIPVQESADSVCGVRVDVIQ
jgi:hypothetical protein